MKKISLIILSALACWGITSCDEYTLPNPPAQSNPAPSVVDPAAVTVTSGLTDAVYSLESLEQAGSDITIANVVPGALPEGSAVVPRVFFSADDFVSQVEVPAHARLSADSTSYEVYVLPADLQKEYYSGISKSPKEKTLGVRMLIGLRIDGALTSVGGPDNFYVNAPMKVLPVPSAHKIESSYYLIGTACDWTMSKALKFDHSDVDPYDDPNFTLIVEITKEQAAAGWWWKIIPQSTFEAGSWVNAAEAQYGVKTNGDDAESGVLVGMEVGADGEVTLEPSAGCLKTAGMYELAINMEECTYSFTPLRYLYTPGDSNGWNFKNCQKIVTDDYTVYKGYVFLKGSFKFTSAPDWSHVNYGAGDKEGELSTDGGAGNLSVPAEGLYYCDVNTETLTYTLSHVTTYGLIGDATPNGWDASTPLTPSADFLVWTATMELKAGSYKFRANNSWDINLGGDISDLSEGGANIDSPGAGTYEITLDLSNIPYKATLVKK